MLEIPAADISATTAERHKLRDEHKALGTGRWSAKAERAAIAKAKAKAS